MKRDAYRELQFECTSCNNNFKQYTWLSKAQSVVCPNCGSSCEEIIEKIQPSFNIGGKYRKGRPEKEKRQRREKSFKEEVLPNLSGWERKYFEKKYKK